MKSAAYTLVGAVVAALLPGAAAAAGKYSWFDGDPAATGPLAVRPSTFGLDVYRSFGESADQTLPPVAEHTVSLYGDFETRALGAFDDNAASHRFVNFGIRWKHRLSMQDELAVSAEQGEGMLSYRDVAFANADTLDTRATVSWTREMSLWGWRPSIIGGVFLGEEAARDDTRGFGRRYYGFTVGGELRLMQSHTPYVSFRLERSTYDLPDAGMNGSGASSLSHATDDFTQVSAGWRWEIQQGWSLQAEASYGFDLDRDSDPLGLRREGSRVFFGTRFDFR